jgi:glycosyltransferase involved in cell wall biosynthesis
MQFSSSLICFTRLVGLLTPLPFYSLKLKKINLLFIQRPDAKTQSGGDILHLQATQKALQARGVAVSVASPREAKNKQAQIIHAFNLGKPQNILPLIRPNGPPLVLSSVFVDYKSTPQNSVGLKKIAAAWLSADALEYVKSLARWLKRQEPWPGWYYLLNGHRKSVKKVIAHCSALVTASAAEYDLIKSRYGPAKKQLSVAVGHEHFPKAVAAEKRAGVLCAARIEPLKNQLNLIRACQNLGLPLSLAGAPSRNHQAYYLACKEAGKSTVRWLGQLPAKDLAQAMARAKIHALPSFYESTGLSTIEALKNGCAVVVSNSPISLELFKINAHYCQPQSVSSLENALQKALDQEPSNTTAVIKPFSWALAAEKLEHLYSELCSTKKE